MTAESWKMRAAETALVILPGLRTRLCGAWDGRAPETTSERGPGKIASGGKTQSQERAIRDNSRDSCPLNDLAMHGRNVLHLDRPGAFGGIEDNETPAIIAVFPFLWELSFAAEAILPRPFHGTSSPALRCPKPAQPRPQTRQYHKCSSAALIFHGSAVHPPRDKSYSSLQGLTFYAENTDSRHARR